LPPILLPFPDFSANFYRNFLILPPILFSAPFPQTSFFTEIREIVRPEDLPRFDCLIYQRGNLLDKLLRRSKVVRSYDDDDQVTRPTFSRRA
jgi:hypothetical protein